MRLVETTGSRTDEGRRWATHGSPTALCPQAHMFFANLHEQVKKWKIVGMKYFIAYYYLQD